jgi:hypothetical protein
LEKKKIKEEKKKKFNEAIIFLDILAALLLKCGHFTNLLTHLFEKGG